MIHFLILSTVFDLSVWFYCQIIMFVNQQNGSQAVSKNLKIAHPKYAICET